MNDYTLDDDVLIDHRVAGMEALLNPFGIYDSSPRLDMAAKHTVQSLVLKGNEFPKVFSGYETIFGRYMMDTAERDQDAEIIAVIPKYLFTAKQHMSENPELTVIYRGLSDKKISYFTVSKYSKGTDGYGYYNTIVNQHLLTPGTYLPKDVQLTKSPAHHGAMYNLGTNANVAYITLPETVDDAFVISRSLAEKATTKSIKTISIRIPSSYHPLNLYGDDIDLRFMPDIGEQVRDDGIICGFRTPTNTTFMADTQSTILSEPQYLHDKLYRAPKGSIVLDIDCYMNKMNVPKHLWLQVDRYMAASTNYYKSVVDIYNTYKSNSISNAFNTLVTKAMSRLLASGSPVRGVQSKTAVKLSNRENQIDFLQIDITYAYDLKVERGFKFTDRHGHKGVVAAIWEDEDMPIDDNEIGRASCRERV